MPRINSQDKPSDVKGTIKKLLSYVSQYKASFIIIFIVAILSTIFSILGPKILGNATQELYSGLLAKVGGTGGINFQAIYSILLFLLTLYLLSAIFSFF